MVATYVANDAAAPFRDAQRRRVAVNGVAIPTTTIAREVQYHGAGSPLDAWKAAVRSLVIRELLLQEGRRLGVEAAPRVDEDGRREADEEAIVRQVIEREVLTPVPDEASCRRYYIQNEQRFRSANLYEAAHILMPVRADNPQGVSEVQELAMALCGQLQLTPGAFAELARQHSACPSAAVGGNLGQIGTGDTTPEFEDALTKLKPGEITRQPVASRFGFHIVRLDRTIEGRLVPFEVVHGRIANYLKERSERLAIAQYLARLASQAEIEGIDLPRPHDLGVL